MALTPKERMRKAILYEPVDRLPTQINYTKPMGKRLAEYYKVSVDELPSLLDNHMIRLDISYLKRASEDKKIEFDWWEVGFDAEEEGYFPAVNPLAGIDDLDKYDWPDPDAPGLLDAAAKVISTKGDQFFITPNFGFVLFERAWALRGFENFFMDMSINPGFVNELLDRITDIQLRLIHRFIDLGVHGGYFGDDYGAQKGLMFSPKMWRDYIKPRLARLFEPFRDMDMPVLMHSDGQIHQILPDLVEIGLTTLNPVQPEVLDHQWLRKTFGKTLNYYGGISTQTVLPSGTPDEVQLAVKKCIKDLAPDNSGLILAPSHRMMTDIPLENVDALRKAYLEMAN
jgi:uroporphyrinogen decarboxylase